jgi:glutaryl-CoA dehydrogenase
MTTDDIGRARGTDYFLIAEQLTADELDYLLRARAFVDHEVLPVINGYWEAAEFPFELVEKLAKLDLVGGIDGYGCAPMSPIAEGLVNMELNRGDGSVGTFYGVHVGLAMKSIALLGSAEQRERWLPPMARLETIGAFALTEPEHGSDSIALETTARREGDGWVLDGRKRWIGNGSIADVVVVWARDTSDNQVKGFVVEKGTPGYRATVIEGKLALRSVWNAQIELTGCRVPDANRLAHAASFKDAARVLAGTRNTVAWGSLGHAVAAYEIALAYAKDRHQFGRPLVGFQLVQDKLVRMLCEVTAMQLYCLRLGRLIEEGGFTDTIAALAKLNNTVKAREVCALAREVLGGNGILLEYHVARHMADMEALYTYEGTAEIQTLIVGRDITGLGAFA